MMKKSTLLRILCLSHHHALLHLVVAMSVALMIGKANGGSTWVSTNPGGGGGLNSPVIFPLSGSGAPNVYVVGSDLGGVYISFDQGKSYKAVGVTSGLLATHVGSMAAFRLTTGPWRLLVGTDNGIFVGTFRNNTAGIPTFAQVSSTNGGYISALAIAAIRYGMSNQVIYATMYAGYAGTTPIILRSDDSGLSFISVAHNLPSYLNLRVVGMRSHPVDRRGIWIVTGKGRFGASVAQAYFSKDSGVTWTRMDPNKGRVVDVAYSQNSNNLNELLLTTEGKSDDGTTAPPAAIYINYETGYGTWIALSTNVAFGVSGFILEDATNSQHIRTLELRPNSIGQYYRWETLDGGKTWQNSINVVQGGWAQNGQTWGFAPSFQGILQSVGYRPDAPNYVVWVETQFVKLSVDGAKTWLDGVSNQIGPNSFQSRGLDNVVPAIVEPSKANSSLVFAGYFDLGLWRSSDSGKSWEPLNKNVINWNYNWHGIGGNTITVVADPVRSNVVWAQVAGDLYDPIHLVKSTDGGNTWFECMSGLPGPAKGLLIESLQVVTSSPVNSRRLLVVAGGDIYLSTDDGATWAKVLSCGDCFGVRVASFAVFAFGPSGVWKSTSNGSAGSFQALSLPASMTTGWKPGSHWLNDHWTYAGPMDMTWRGNSEVWLAVLRGGGLYYSSDGGQSWRLVYSNYFVRTVSVDPSTGQALVGSSSAIYAGGYNTNSKGLLLHRTGTSSSRWTATNAGLVFPFATFVTVTPTGQRWLISPGQGILKWA